MSWKFGLILAHKDELDVEDDTCLLVELYDLDNNEQYHSWCLARISSPVELEMAQRDVLRDGINTWFYDNGKFELQSTVTLKWDWVPN